MSLENLQFLGTFCPLPAEARTISLLPKVHVLSTPLHSPGVVHERKTFTQLKPQGMVPEEGSQRGALASSGEVGSNTRGAMLPLVPHEALEEFGPVLLLLTV